MEVSLVFLAGLGDSNSKTDAETIRACQRMFLLPLWPPTPPLALWLHIKVVDRVLKLILLFDSLKQLSVFKGAVACGCRPAQNRQPQIRPVPAKPQCRGVGSTQAQMHTVSGPKICCIMVWLSFLILSYSHALGIPKTTFSLRLITR